MTLFVKFLFVGIISISLVAILTRNNTWTHASCRCNPNVCDVYDNVKNEVISINTTKCYNKFVMYDTDSNTFTKIPIPLSVLFAIVYAHVTMYAYMAVFILMTICDVIVYIMRPVKRNTKENDVPRRRSARIKNLNTTQIISISNR